jgi:hypothetical protein
MTDFQDLKLPNEEPILASQSAHAEVPPEADWRTEAGRKGARRIHELIEAGRRYEEQHGLKSGRQRLRQLIELGKQYERDQGVEPGRKRRGTRLSRADRDEVISTLVRCLVRLAKPAFRSDLEKLANVLRPATLTNNIATDPQSDPVEESHAA